MIPHDTDTAALTVCSFNVSFLATEQDARTGLSKVMAALEQANLPLEAASNIEIALTEAVNNVVEHAFAGLSPAEVHVSSTWKSGWLQMQIRDSGHGFSGGSIPKAKSVNLDVPLEDLPEGGFGWFLIQTLADTVSYERQDGDNVLSLVFSLKNPEG